MLRKMRSSHFRSTKCIALWCEISSSLFSLSLKLSDFQLIRTVKIRVKSNFIFTLENLSKDFDNRLIKVISEGWKHNYKSYFILCYDINALYQELYHSQVAFIYVFPEWNNYVSTRENKNYLVTFMVFPLTMTIVWYNNNVTAAFLSKLSTEVMSS